MSCLIGRERGELQSIERVIWDYFHASIMHPEDAHRVQEEGKENSSWTGNLLGGGDSHHKGKIKVL